MVTVLPGINSGWGGIPVPRDHTPGAAASWLTHLQISVDTAPTPRPPYLAGTGLTVTAPRPVRPCPQGRGRMPSRHGARGLIGPPPPGAPTPPVAIGLSSCALTAQEMAWGSGRCDCVSGSSDWGGGEAVAADGLVATLWALLSTDEWPLDQPLCAGVRRVPGVCPCVQEGGLLRLWSASECRGGCSDWSLCAEVRECGHPAESSCVQILFLKMVCRWALAPFPWGVSTCPSPPSSRSADPMPCPQNP